MKPWLLGNTTVRSPFRLRDGLIAISQSPLQGNLRGQEQEIALRLLLGNEGIVALGSDATNSVGRKWRSALEKLGFLIPEIPASSGILQADIGPLDMISKNGWRLISADTVPAMQECFLRALAAYYIWLPPEANTPPIAFSPLRHILALMLELEKQTGLSTLTFIEMAVIAQLSNSTDDLTEITSRILALRNERSQSANKKAYDNAQRQKAAEEHDYQAGTFNDYADTNFRYLKATGLVQNDGRGIVLVNEKHIFVENLVSDISAPDTAASYFASLCNGAKLPTDNQDSARLVLDDLLQQLDLRKIPFSMQGVPIGTPADIAVVRHQIEDLISKNNEEKFASEQAAKWEEITAYMELLISRGRKKELADGTEIEIPQSEGPAYFEWVLWRAFLAINSLSNKPYESRRFKIDQNFLPVGTAPGNGPDLIFEFDDFVLVVEVTLTANSRQEAAEGEPVRRHVAQIAENYATKRVFGLFIANKIDTNTAETFRIGFWYKADDTRTALQIVPITLEQFKALFSAGFQHQNISPRLILNFIRDCLAVSNHEAPVWKQEIQRATTEAIQNLRTQH